MNYPSENRPRLYALDAMRGLCAVALMVYHYRMWNGVNQFQIGFFGVYIFFMLSGFSLWYVYANRKTDVSLLHHFFAARIARIMPLYAVVALAGGVARVAQGGHDVINLDFFYRLALNIGMLFGLAMPGKTSFIPGGWSIGIEFVFYLAFPLFLIFTSTLKRMLVLLAASLALNQLIVAALLKDGSIVEQWTSYTNFPTFIVYFVAGIATAMLYARWKDKPSCPFFSRVIPLGMLAMIFWWPSENAESFLLGWQLPLFVLAGMVGILCAAFVKPKGAELKVYRFLGDVSYSTYLLNFFVYQAVDKAYPGHVEAVIAFSVASSLLLAYLSYRFYEMPARRWLNAKLGD